MIRTSESQPTISAFLEDSISGLGTVVLADTPVGRVTQAVGPRVHSIRLRRTAATMSVRVHVPLDGQAVEPVVFLVDGAASPHAQAAPGIHWLRLPLADDFERHTVACVISGRFTCYLDIEVLAWRSWSEPGVSEPMFAAPKWTSKHVESALAQYASSAKQTTKRSSFDLTNRRLAVGRSTTVQQAVQALHFAAERLAALCASARHSDLLPDYPAHRSPVVDMDATRESLRRNPRWLTPAEGGPILWGASRYTTAQLEWRTVAGSDLDLRVPITLLETLALSARARPDCAAAALFLRDARKQLTRLTKGKVRQASERALATWLASTPRSSVARALKSRLRQVAALMARTNQRSSDHASGIAGLDKGFRDFDLFEWSCGRAVCEALGGDLASLAAGAGVVSAGLHNLILPNRADGQIAARALLRGWRDGSEMPSGYAPDFVIVWNRTTPVIVDAKFRVSDSLSIPCAPDAVKEVQAYLDEFGLVGAVILVPLIPRRVLAAERAAGSALISGTANGRSKRVWIVEYAPGLEGFTDRLLVAVQDVAAAQVAL